MVIAICDDNKLDREQCKARLARLAAIQNLGVDFFLYRKGEELLFHLQGVKEKPDIIYLNMKMPGLYGDEVAKRLREQGCTSEIIYFTASKAFYDSAFEVNAFHYVVKGETSEQKFREIFERAVSKVKEKQADFILCVGAGEYRNIEIRKIRYFQVVKRIVSVVYGESEEFSFYSTIAKIEKIMENHGFVRINRSYLIALSHIRAISFKGVSLDNGEVLAIGRSYYNNLKQKMEEYAGYSDKVV